MDQEQARYRAKQLFWLIGVPVIMLLIGVWQWSRVPSVDPIQERIAEYREQIPRYQARIDELDEMVAKASPKWAIPAVQDEEGRSIDARLARSTAALAKSHAEDALQKLESAPHSTVFNWLKPLAIATTACGALALLWAGVGLAYQRRIGTQAMRSREQLLAAFLRGKRLLPTYMAVMVVLLLGAAIMFLVCDLLAASLHPSYSRSDVRLMMGAVTISAALLYYGVKILIGVIRAVRRPVTGEPVRVMGQIVTREQAPKLWSFVGKVAQRIGADMPHAIVVGLNEGFFVTEHPVQLVSGTSVPKGRVLYLPLPYMAFMKAAEVAAVIGHELGHFMGEDTVYSQRFSPIYAATIRHLNAVAGTGGGWLSLVTQPAAIFGEMFLDSFHKAVRFWSRKRELAADAVGVQVAGAQAMAASLLRIAALEPRVAEALAAHWDSAQTVAGGVLGHVRQLVATKGMVKPSERLQNRQPHPFDTHPELAARLEAVGMPVNDELLRRAMDPSGSNLLQEFGLEAQPAAASSQTAEAGASVAANINAALQSELTSVAAANRQAKIKELSALVRQAQAVQPVYRRWMPRSMLLLVLILVVFIPAVLSAVLGGLLFFRGIFLEVKNPNTHWIGLAFLTLGLGVVAWGIWLFRRKPKLSLTIRPDGLELPGQPAVLPWSAITDLRLVNNAGNLNVYLDLDRQTPAPKFGMSFSRRYVKNKHQVILVLVVANRKQLEQVGDTIVIYHRAHHARVELQRMGEEERSFGASL